MNIGPHFDSMGRFCSCTHGRPIQSRVETLFTESVKYAMERHECFCYRCASTVIVWKEPIAGIG